LPSVFVRFPAQEVSCLIADLSSFMFDYSARQKVGGTNFGSYIAEQLPVLLPSTYSQPCPWSNEETYRDWLLPRALELIFTAWDMEPFAQDCGNNNPLFRWNAQRRFQIRCEIDAAFFHLYATNRDDTAYILETFPIVKRKDIEENGHYRTQEAILEIYDAMAEAVRTGQPYQTRLDPPPGPPADGLPVWKPGQPKPANWPSHIHPPRGCRATPTDEWRLSDLADDTTLPRSFKLVLEEHEAGNGVERRWKCKRTTNADPLPERDTWVLIRHPDLKRGATSFPVALGKWTYQELTDASTREPVIVVTLRGPVPPAQVRIPLAEWSSFRPLAVLEPLDS